MLPLPPRPPTPLRHVDAELGLTVRGEGVGGEAGSGFFSSLLAALAADPIDVAVETMRVRRSYGEPSVRDIPAIEIGRRRRNADGRVGRVTGPWRGGRGKGCGWRSSGWRPQRPQADTGADRRLLGLFEPCRHGRVGVVGPGRSEAVHHEPIVHENGVHVHEEQQSTVTIAVADIILLLGWEDVLSHIMSLTPR